uniref:Uncharacterized protein n=1 Tax=Glossina austeni TaxID=7395 RepID=A0A1A9V285_GLOAU
MYQQFEGKGKVLEEKVDIAIGQLDARINAQENDSIKCFVAPLMAYGANVHYNLDYVPENKLQAKTMPNSADDQENLLAEVAKTLPKQAFQINHYLDKDPGSSADPFSSASVTRLTAIVRSVLPSQKHV